MTKTIYEVEISRGIDRKPITFTRIASSEDHIKIAFAGEKITRIAPVKTIKLGKVDIKA